MPDWGKLKEQGRAKDVGIPWSTEEAEAVFGLKVPAKYVRRGALTHAAANALIEKDEQHLKEEGELPLEAMHHNELVVKAGTLGVEVTSHATDEGLIAVIEAAEANAPEVKEETPVEETPTEVPVEETPTEVPVEETPKEAAVGAAPVAKKKKK